MTSTLQQVNNLPRTPSSSFSGLLDIDRIKRNPIYKCSITSTNGIDIGKANGNNVIIPTITGIYNSDSSFGINMSSSWADTFEQPDIVDAANQITGFISNMSGRSQFLLKSLRMTEKRWTGSTSPSFNVKIDIPVIRKSSSDEENPWKVMQHVLRTVSGTLQNYQSGSDQIQSVDSSYKIYAPNGYRIVYSGDAQTGDTPKGTYQIALGSGEYCWFRMNNAVITNASCSISNKKYKDGNPVNVSLSISFEYWRMPMYEDIVEWFPLA